MRLLPPRPTTALVGPAPDCFRIAMHLRGSRRRIARFDFSPLSLSLLADAVRAGQVTDVVAVRPEPAEEALLGQVLGALDLDVSLYVSPLDGVRPEGRRLGILPVRPIAQRPIPRWGRVLKGLADRAGAAILLALLLPLLACVAAAIRLESPAPVFVRAWREGRNGIAFPLLTFRTTWEGEPTLVGRLLRRTGLAQLPLLFNVLRGDMSLVGPRPHEVAQHAAGRPCAEIAPDYPWRHRVKPGLTGLAQVAGLRGALATPDDLRARLALDLAYISEWSFALDLRLLLLTPWRRIFAGAARPSWPGAIGA